ncbi:helix-turn-helix domain-containing protein [Escherichia coli]
MSGYSRRYTEFLFKRHTGLSLGKYIKRRKLTRTAYLLRYTTSRVIDITFRLNFDSPQSFSREFKKMFGKSPVAFRNSEIWDISLMLPPLTLRAYPNRILFQTMTPQEKCSIAS